MTTYLCDRRCKRGACGCGRPDVLADGDSIITTLIFSDAARDGIPFRDAETSDADNARAAMIADMAGEHRKTTTPTETGSEPEKPVVATDANAADAYAKMVADLQSGRTGEAA